MPAAGYSSGERTLGVGSRFVASIGDGWVSAYSGHEYRPMEGQVRPLWGTPAIASLLLGALALVAGALVACSDPGTTVREKPDGYEPGQTDYAWTADRRSTLHTEDIDQPLGGARRAVVDVGVGVGPMDLSAMNELDGPVDGMLARWDGGKIARDFRVSGETAYLTLRGENAPAFQPGGDGSPRWHLRLSPEVPAELEIHGSVGQAEIDLSKLQLTGLEVDVGVGGTVVTLPRRGRLRARVSGGVGSLSVLIPRGVSARIHLEQGLGGIDLFGNYEPRDDNYVSPGYELAQDRVELTVQGGVGKVTVQEMDAE